MVKGTGKIAIGSRYFDASSGGLIVVFLFLYSCGRIKIATIGTSL